MFGERLRTGREKNLTVEDPVEELAGIPQVPVNENDAVGALTRLVDLSVAPFLVSATVEAVLAQRLVRTVP